MCLLAASYNKRNKLTKQMHAHIYMLRVGRSACSGGRGRGGRVEVEVQVDVEVQVEVEVEVQAEVQMQVEVEVECCGKR